MSQRHHLIFHCRECKPPGGIRKGQVMSVPYYPQWKEEESSASEVTPFFVDSKNAPAPPGIWKDGLFDCCRLGWSHASVWNALCCPQLLMAQVLTRLKLNWLGDLAPENEWRRTFSRIFALVSVYWILSYFLAPAPAAYDWDEHGEWVRVPAVEGSLWQERLYNFLTWVFGVYSLIVLTKLRRMVRLRYEIPVTFAVLGEYEDCCLSFWCGCCAVAQMARHTCDYSHQRAACCSPTGLAAVGSEHLRDDSSMILIV